MGKSNFFVIGIIFCLISSFFCSLIHEHGDVNSALMYFFLFSFQVIIISFINSLLLKVAEKYLLRKRKVSFVLASILPIISIILILSNDSHLMFVGTIFTFGLGLTNIVWAYNSASNK